ncbi:uncharacterized protein LOC111874655 isoform X3 [Cryptotermes secundus]|nr:uncharacterized protein LOC111874655 isoform X3 [Cryptotermes secundus]
MSDSDDTDVLLLIPPDFFLVYTSDSEDSIGPEVWKGYNESHEFEKLVVNDLISQVNELETRISIIENKSSVDLPESAWETSCLDQVFDCATYQNLNAYHYLRHKDLTLMSQSMSSTQHRFGGSYDNLRVPRAVNCGINSLHSTPVKQKQAFSLPSTPSIDSNESHFPSNSTQDRGSTSPEKSAIIIEPVTPNEIINMSHSVVGSIVPSSRATVIGVMQGPSNNSKQNKLRQDYTLIGEIDQFLDSIKKSSKVPAEISVSDCNKKENIYKCGENSASIPDQGFGLADFNNLPVREELIKSKYIAPLENEGTASVKQADDEVLKEAKNGVKDTKHPNPKPAHEQLYQQKKGYTCGDTVTSVPDLGFGLRSFNSLPVREEEVKRKTVLPLEAHQLDIEMGGLELSDIGKLLKQMEATEHEIEKKLQLRESSIEKHSTLSEKDCVPPPQNMSFGGDTISSVPDSGFGVRDVLNSPRPVPSYNAVTSTNGAKVPVQEELVPRRNISLLGTEVTADKTQGSQVHSSIEPLTDEQNIHMSNVETVKKTEGAPHIVSNSLDEREDMKKVAVARRKLELSNDASTIPDCNFGLKSWYAAKNKDGYSESPLHSSHNVPHYVHDSVIPSHPSGARITSSSTDKGNDVQGYYLPSVPDLGFGLQKLWTNDALSQGLGKNVTTFSPKHNTSAQSQIRHIHANDDITAVEYSLLSKPHVTANETGDQRLWYEGSNVVVQGQRNSVAAGGTGSTVTDTTAKKKVDFNVGSHQRDVAIMQQEQGSEGLRNKTDAGNTFIDSGVNGMTASVSSGTSNLLSLSELWGKDGSSFASHIGNEHTNIGLRLEEEKYRRQLCERLIQQLQARLLEEQQKLAVAVQVDRGKDQAILQLQHAWKRLVHHWIELEEQRHNLASRLQNEREEHQRKESEMAQKLKQLESELSKALDLAHGYKKKLDIVETEKLELIEHHNSDIKGMNDRIQEEKQKLDKAIQFKCQIVQEKDDLLEKVKQAEEKVEKERKLLIDAQREVQDTHKKLYSLEAELSALKEEKETLQLKLKEEKGRISILDQQKKSLQATLDEYKKKEKSLQEEMRQLTGQLEKIKVELREYYQEQLEIVVRDKLREFQEQLDAAETSLHKELEQREHALNEMASKQVKEISEKHQLEMKLLEEKHMEELQLYKLQLAQTVQQASHLEAKLQGYNSRKSEMVEKLHSVMETQWQEALRIVSGNNPLVNCGAEYVRLQRKENFSVTDTSTWPCVTHSQSTALDNGPFSTLKNHSNDEHHTRKTGTASGTNDETHSKSSKMVVDTPHEYRDFTGMSQPCVTPVHLQQNIGSLTADEIPFSRDGLLTYRKAEQLMSLQGTPLSKECLKTNQQDELKRYIMMLLDRSPGNPVDEGALSTDHRPDVHKEKEVKQNGCSQGDKRCQHVDIPTNEDTHLSLAGGQHESIQSIPSYYLSKAGHGSARDVRHVKPPWK